MGIAIIVFMILPVLSKISHSVFRSETFSSDCFNSMIHPTLTVIFYSIFILLGWLGSKPVEEPYTSLGAVLVFFYFFLILYVFWLNKVILFLVYKYKNPFKKGALLILKKVRFSSVFLYYLDEIFLPFEFLYAVEISFIFIFVFFTIFLLSLLLLLSITLSGSFFHTKNTQTTKSFECGFDPFLISASSKINIHSLKVIMLFVLFDLELIFIFP